MSSLRLHRATFAYGDGRPVLTDITLDLTPGWTGVVGDNGAGKTTLLRALLGQLAPIEGEVHRASTAVAAVTQRVDAADEAVLELAADWSKAGLRWRARLDLEDGEVERWPTLSEGQRKRWQVAAALAGRPDLLVLDEPTNHLDGDARAALLGALERFDGIGVVVSHDRDLLDRLTERTVFVEQGGLRTLNLPYGPARAALESEARAAGVARAEARRTARGAQRRAQERAETARSAARSKSARVRMKSPKDRDGASVNAQSRAAKAEAALSRRAGAARARAEAAQDSLPQGPDRRSVGRAVQLESRAGGSRWLARLEGEDLIAGDRVLARDLRLHLARGARVHLAGANGAGKSTLLVHLEAAAHGAVVRVEQDRSAAQAARAREEIAALPKEARGRVLSLAAALGADPDAVLSGRPPTPGQAQKLALASALGRPFDLVLLDEPTSHLDLSAVERLEAALAGFEGTLVLVTHDPALAAAATDSTWHLGPDGLTVRSRAAPTGPDPAATRAAVRGGGRP